MTDDTPVQVACPRCGHTHLVTPSHCPFCAAPVHPAAAHCPHCGKPISATLSQCLQCGAPIDVPQVVSASSHWDKPPAGLAQLGYISLIVFGALLAVGGIGYGIVAILVGHEVVDGVLSLSATTLGMVLALSGMRAFQAARWRQFALPSEWTWLGGTIPVWLLGILLQAFGARIRAWALPPVIVLGAALTSSFFLSATWRGLKAPVERQPRPGVRIPRHIVLLSGAVSGSLSILISLLLEGLLVATVMAVMLTMTRWLDDPFTLELLERAAQDPQTLQRLEEMIVNSPVALAGLGCLVVVVAPAIEELAKGLPLFFFARRGSRLTEHAAILLGVAGGIGFAFAENAGYLSMLAEEWWLVFWFRAGAAVMHGAASGFIGRAWHRGIKGGRWGAMLLDLLTGWGIHGFWNALALLVGWFAYREVMAGVAFCVIAGLAPLAILFIVLARWGIWISDT